MPVYLCKLCKSTIVSSSPCVCQIGLLRATDRAVCVTGAVVLRVNAQAISAKLHSKLGLTYSPSSLDVGGWLRGCLGGEVFCFCFLCCTL